MLDTWTYRLRWLGGVGFGSALYQGCCLTNLSWYRPMQGILRACLCVEGVLHERAREVSSARYSAEGPGFESRRVQSVQGVNHV